MGWEDRQYYRENGSGDVPGHWRTLVFGSVYLFTFSRIRVRLHASLILTILITLIFGGIGARGFDLANRAQSMAMLFFIVLLHEFGHCFASRWVGGDPEEIMLTPLGGLAYANAPHRPGATAITVAGGPAVNVLICLFATAALWLMGRLSLLSMPSAPWLSIASYLFWINIVSLTLLIFNMLPLFPLDGGQLLQSLLWFKFGFTRAMNIACLVGLVGWTLFAIIFLLPPNPWMLLLAGSGIFTCIAMRRQIKEMGPEFDTGAGEMDFSASLAPDKPRKRRRASRWQVRRLRRQAEADHAEQQRIDTILAKVSASGMNSLTWSERRALRRATERQRRSEIEFANRDIK